ncbi:hypothetical protein BJX64DRAFT_289153 [Aspergillus heterothallicus]
MSFPPESSFSAPLRPAPASRRSSDKAHEKAAPPRKTQTPQTGFLFVDALADNPQNHALKKEKQVFVLNKYFRRRREAAIERVKPSKPLPSSSSRLRPELPPQYRSRIPGEDQNGEHRQGSSKYSSEPCDAIAEYAAAQSQMQSLTTYLSQGHTDPFSSVALDMTNPQYSYFYHFRTHTIPACYPLDATRISTYWWRQAITQPALLQALMFLAAGHQASLQLSSGRSSSSSSSSSQDIAVRAIRDSLRSRGDSLRLLQEIIRDPAWAVAESTGLAIATLVTIEAVNANFTAVEAHMKGLQRLVGLFGGLERANHMFLSKIYLYVYMLRNQSREDMKSDDLNPYRSDVKAAALTSTRPSFPIVAKWRAAILQHARLYENQGPAGERYLEPGSDLDPRLTITPNRTSAVGLGSAIFTAPWYPTLAPSMRRFLGVFARLTGYYETAVADPSLVRDTDNDLYILLEHQLLDVRYYPTTTLPAEPEVLLTAADDADNIGSEATGGETRRRLLLSDEEENDNENNNTSPLNEPLRLTLLVLLMTRMWHLQPFPAMEYVTASLRDALVLDLDLDLDLLLLPLNADPDRTLDNIPNIPQPTGPGIRAPAPAPAPPNTVLATLRKTSPPLVFWILFVGATASRGYTTRAWFVEQLGVCVRDLGLDLGGAGWAQAREVLRGFFWSEQECFRADEEGIWGVVSGMGLEK